MCDILWIQKTHIILTDNNGHEVELWTEANKPVLTYDQ